ncbi:MAG: hypothetical protein PHI44_05465, partial [Candidatus Ratteibacteria bacterium]|nr:hypothetical protein [Candidatus Ratteibacteria bacterium]
MRHKDEKFRIGEGNDIDGNIRKLQKELDDMLLKGAPEIKEVPVDEEVKSTLLNEKKVKVQEEKAPVIPEKRYTIHYDKPAKSSKKTFWWLKNRRFYIAVFGVVALALTLIKAPVFRYTTPIRHDNDLPEIDVCFKYY